jgi:hypothetical protein
MSLSKRVQAAAVEEMANRIRSSAIIITIYERRLPQQVRTPISQNNKF